MSRCARRACVVMGWHTHFSLGGRPRGKPENSCSRSFGFRGRELPVYSVCVCLHICGVAVHTDALAELLIEREFLHSAREDHTVMKRLIYLSYRGRFFQTLALPCVMYVTSPQQQQQQRHQQQKWLTGSLSVSLSTKCSLIKLARINKTAILTTRGRVSLITGPAAVLSCPMRCDICKSTSNCPALTRF